LSTDLPNTKYSYETVGVIPAAGWATRIAPLPFSKELYPIGFSITDRNHLIRPKVVCQYLLERLRLAGINKAYMVLRDGKWDIPAHFRDGHSLNMDLAYLMMRIPYGVPYTLDQAYPFVKDAVVALGFPDIIFHPDDAFSQLLTKQAHTHADIVLGLAPIEASQNWDMVELAKDGRIHRIHVKQPGMNLPYGWFIAVWTPIFSNFMHEYLVDLQKLEEENNAEGNVPQKKELYIGDVFQAAIHNEMHIETVLFRDGSCIDIGTPEGIKRAVQMVSKM
jgi:glucose-1-phosphate thymidylyltransferase